MYFCTACDNMCYVKILEHENGQDPNLIYYCRNCGQERTEFTSDDICVSKLQLKKPANTFSHIINPYTKLDPTLPRVDTILCPNSKCQTNHAQHPAKREIIYIRYDDANMKYVYLCSTCDYVWRITDAL